MYFIFKYERSSYIFPQTNPLKLLLCEELRDKLIVGGGENVSQSSEEFGRVCVREKLRVNVATSKVMAMGR